MLGHMKSRHLKFAALFAISAILASACSSSSDAAEAPPTTTTTVAETTTTTVPPTTTTVPPTTSTTEPGPEISEAINGLPAEEKVVDRRVVAVKIDNHPNARPQSALQSADAVYEVLVEGGITRFIALFHQTDLDWVGPNRSGRPTDSTIMAALEGGPFQISGAQSWVKSLYRNDGINFVEDNGVTTYRVNDRSAPHNLFTSTLKIRRWADDKNWPDVNPGNLFAYGEPTSSSERATKIEVSFSDAPTPTWAWDGEQYRRFHGIAPHMWTSLEGETAQDSDDTLEEGTGQVSFDTLVVMRMDKYTMRDPTGQGSSLPTVHTVGKGEAFVFHDGVVVSGTWERGSQTDKFFLLEADGTEIVLPPGRVWISLQPDDQPLVWE
jgi:hypothetical protein